MGRGELAMSLIIFAASIFLFFYTFTFPSFPQYRSVDSDFWPQIVLALLIFTSFMLVMESVRKKRRLQSMGQDGEKGPEREGLFQMLGTAALLFLYVFIGLQYVGFTLSTLFFIAAIMWVLGNRKPVQLVLTPLLVTGFSVVIFARFLFVPLPRGVGIFYLFSLLFY